MKRNEEWLWVILSTLGILGVLSLICCLLSKRRATKAEEMRGYQMGQDANSHLVEKQYQQQQPNLAQQPQMQPMMQQPMMQQ